MSGNRAEQRGLSGIEFALDQATHARINGKVGEIISLVLDSAGSEAERSLRDHLIRLEKEKAMAEGILSSLGAGITVQDRDFRIVYQNSAMAQAFGTRLGEPCYLSYQSLDSRCTPCPVADSFDDGQTHAAERAVSANGSSRFLENVASPLRDAAGNIVAAVELVRDITKKKELEEKLTRLGNLYQALSHTHKAILTNPDRELLFHEICRIGVTYGRFCLVCIALSERGSGLLKPVACNGNARGYLESLRVSVDESVAEGQGPTGIALRGNTPYICNDFLGDPLTALWRETAATFGIAASAAFPLEQDGAVVGALKVYSGTQGFFDEEMVTLLQEMATSISFALENFARDEKRRRTEAALKESEERLQLVLQGSRDAFWDWDVRTGALKVSDRYFEMLGRSPGEIEGSEAAFRKLVHPEDRPVLHEVLAEHLAGRTSAYVVEFRMGTGDGGWVWFLERGKVVARDRGGAPLRLAGTCSDITERKGFEENLRYMSTHDSMTGLFNRTYFDAELERTSPSRHYPISIVIADVDGLKYVNDSFGHVEGDRLICQAAQALKEAFRAEDVIARIGGDEFAVILPDTDAAAVKEAVRRVREVQAKINEKNADYTLSLSIGAATATSSTELAASLRLADSRMYYYKFQRKGRGP